MTSLSSENDVEVNYGRGRIIPLGYVLDWRARWSARSWHYRPVVGRRELTLWLLLFSLLCGEVLDVIMTVIGLVLGNYEHYNPVGIWLYQGPGLWVFIIYRAVVFLVVYEVVTSKLMCRVRYPLV